MYIHAGMKVIAIILICLSLSCSKHEKRQQTIVVQPFSDISFEEVGKIYSYLTKHFPDVHLAEPIALPESAFYQPRNRYRADSLIGFLHNRAGADTTIIGLTSKDISTTKGKYKDWGIMGLSLRPGNACIVSIFRLKRNHKASQFYKVAIHELGHTQGLPHCDIDSCFMRDAEGGMPLDEETSFCEDCREYMIDRGWMFK